MEKNGESRAKRKQHPVDAGDRATKKFKGETEKSTTFESRRSPRRDGINGMDQSHDEIQPLAKSTGLVEDKAWQATIEKVVKNVVSIHFCQTASFDTDGAISSEATGFVVDAEKGYILTNRHVVCSGPFWGYCIFDNHEEVRI